MKIRKKRTDGSPAKRWKNSRNVFAFINIVLILSQVLWLSSQSRISTFIFLYKKNQPATTESPTDKRK